MLDIKRGKLFPQFDDVDDINTLISFYQAEIQSKSRKTIATSKSLIRNLEAKALSSEGITNDDLKDFEKAKNGLMNAELYDEANKFELSFNSIVNAKKAFKVVQFSSNTDIASVQNKLKQNIGTADTLPLLFEIAIAV